VTGAGAAESDIKQKVTILVLLIARFKFVLFVFVLFLVEFLLIHSKSNKHSTEVAVVTGNTMKSHSGN